MLLRFSRVLLAVQEIFLVTKDQAPISVLYSDIIFAGSREEPLGWAKDKRQDIFWKNPHFYKIVENLFTCF